MTNWRSKPRTGKSQIVPLLPEVQNRLNLGQTYKQIHDALVATSEITLGYQQFVKHINTLLGRGRGVAVKPAPLTFAKPASQAPGGTPIRALDR